MYFFNRELNARCDNNVVVGAKTAQDEQFYSRLQVITTL